MRTDGITAGWVPVARETFEYNLIPWFGLRYAAWLHASVREHPVDPRGQVLIPEPIYRVFSEEDRFHEPVTRAQLQRMGFPWLPAPMLEPPPGLRRRVSPSSSTASRRRSSDRSSGCSPTRRIRTACSS